MEFSDVVRRRRMVRRYSAVPVAPDIIDRLLRNAVRAPSAGFSQAWAFLVLDRPEDVARFWSATTPPERAAEPDRWLRGMRTAPVIVVPMSNESVYRDRYAERDKGATPREEQAWAAPYWHIDTGMASLLILQTAVDEGLGACFFGIPPDRTNDFRTEFGVPADYTPIGAITVGHPSPDERPSGSSTVRRRRPAEEGVHRGHWDG